MDTTEVWQKKLGNELHKPLLDIAQLFNGSLSLPFQIQSLQTTTPQRDPKLLWYVYTAFSLQ